MLYPGKYGNSLVSEEFNQMCQDNHVEATVQVLPNPGIQGVMRVITFRNFNSTTVGIVSQGKKHSMIPARGTAQVMLQPNEELPIIERIDDAA